MHISAFADNKAKNKNKKKPVPADPQGIFVIAWLITIFKADRDNTPHLVYGGNRSNC